MRTAQSRFARIGALPGGPYLLLLLVSLAACSRQPLTLGRNHEDMEMIAARAEASYENKDWAAAADDYALLVEAMPQDANFWFRYGNALARADRPEQAVAAYREVLVRDARYSKAWFNMGIVQLRLAANSFGRMESNVPKDDPLGAQGRRVHAELMRIMGEETPSPDGGTTDGGESAR